MKKALLMMVGLALVLSGCGRETAAASPPLVSAEETMPPLPESCMRYYDFGEREIETHDQSIPLADNAAEADPCSYSVWYQGSYQGLKINPFDEGLTLEELVGDYVRLTTTDGLFLWNGERYDCALLTVNNGYVPNLVPNEKNAVLWLELTGDCTADGGGEELGCFSGFNTVVISGTGTLRIEGCGIACGGGSFPFPALILNGPSLSCSIVSLTENLRQGDTPTLWVRAGELEAQNLFLTGDLCVSGGTATVETVDGVENAVFRGGTFRCGSWTETVVPTLILSGGDATCTEWLPVGTVIEAGAGTITANGIRYWDTLHVYDGGSFVDLMD